MISPSKLIAVGIAYFIEVKDSLPRGLSCRSQASKENSLAEPTGDKGLQDDQEQINQEQGLRAIEPGPLFSLWHPASLLKILLYGGLCLHGFLRTDSFLYRPWSPLEGVSFLLVLTGGYLKSRHATQSQRLTQVIQYPRYLGSLLSSGFFQVFLGVRHWILWIPYTLSLYAILRHRIPAEEALIPHNGTRAPYLLVPFLY